MKTPEELNALKEEVKTVIEKLSALTEDELAQVTGGMKQKLIPPLPVDILPPFIPIEDTSVTADIDALVGVKPSSKTVEP